MRKLPVANDRVVTQATAARSPNEHSSPPRTLQSTPFAAYGRAASPRCPDSDRAHHPCGAWCARCCAWSAAPGRPPSCACARSSILRHLQLAKRAQRPARGRSCRCPRPRVRDHHRPRLMTPRYGTGHDILNQRMVVFNSSLTCTYY